MNNRIYFVGGASAAGKSTITKELSVRSSLPLVELDKFHDILIPAIGERELLIETTRKVALEAVELLLNTKAACIIEGGWIKPARAHTLKNNFGSRFCPVYCGYAGADLATRYLAIQANGTHWLNDKPKSEAHAFLTTQIKESAEYRQECARFHLAFFDCTDFSAGSKALCAHFEMWLQKAEEAA